MQKSHNTKLRNDCKTKSPNHKIALAPLVVKRNSGITVHCPLINHGMIFRVIILSARRVKVFKNAAKNIGLIIHNPLVKQV